MALAFAQAGFALAVLGFVLAIVGYATRTELDSWLSKAWAITTAAAVTLMALSVITAVVVWAL